LKSDSEKKETKKGLNPILKTILQNIKEKKKEKKKKKEEEERKKEKKSLLEDGPTTKGKAL
jgi:hypothetical protein